MQSHLNRCHVPPDLVLTVFSTNACKKNGKKKNTHNETKYSLVLQDCTTHATSRSTTSHRTASKKNSKRTRNDVTKFPQTKNTTSLFFQTTSKTHNDKDENPITAHTHKSYSTLKKAKSLFATKCTLSCSKIAQHTLHHAAPRRIGTDPKKTPNAPAMT